MKANSHSSSCVCRLSREQTTSHPCPAFTQRICRRFRSLRMYLPSNKDTQYSFMMPQTHTHSRRDVGRPVERFETAHIQRQSVLRAGVVMNQPAADASAAKGMFTGRLQGALQHVSTHTAEQTLIHITHKPLQIIAHPTQITQVIQGIKQVGTKT